MDLYIYICNSELLLFVSCLACFHFFCIPPLCPPPVRSSWSTQTAHPSRSWPQIAQGSQTQGCPWLATVLDAAQNSEFISGRWERGGCCAHICMWVCKVRGGGFRQADYQSQTNPLDKNNTVSHWQLCWDTQAKSKKKVCSYLVCLYKTRNILNRWKI